MRHWNGWNSMRKEKREKDKTWNMTYIYIDTGKPSREQILEQIFEQIFNPKIMPIDDETAFLRHLYHKHKKKNKSNLRGNL